MCESNGECDSDDDGDGDIDSDDDGDGNGDKKEKEEEVFNCRELVRSMLLKPSNEEEDAKGNEVEIEDAIIESNVESSDEKDVTNIE